jgi:hypothetical protein
MKKRTEKKAPRRHFTLRFAPDLWRVIDNAQKAEPHKKLARIIEDALRESPLVKNAARKAA